MTQNSDRSSADDRSVPRDDSTSETRAIETRAMSAQDGTDEPTSVLRTGDAPARSGRSGDGLDIPTYTAPDRARPGYAEPQYIPPASSSTGDDVDGLLGEPREEEEADVVPLRRGTTDLGLLLLRVGLGAVLLGHGLQKAFGLFDGPGIDGYRQLLEGSGYRYPEILAYVGSLTELVAGGLLILGLVTPVAAAAALATTINVWFVADLAQPGFAFFVANGGQEYEMLLVVLAAAVAFAGPGRYSLDGRRGWASRPRASSWLSAVVGIAAGLVVWFLLVGTTPFAA